LYILPVAFIYVTEIVCNSKRHKENLEQIAELRNYYTPKQLDIHVDFCNTGVFKKYNKCWNYFYKK